MNFSTIIFIVVLLGAVSGFKKPWIGGITGLIVSPLLFILFTTFSIIPIVIVTLICFPLCIACGFVSSILISGLKGKWHKAGTTYMSGFGVHHPGGFILSNGERQVLIDKHIKREIVISY